ncbi:twin-arginine translocation signal domain-containing protein [bacterium]|nr:twin-arginine translocation signal domain-containing protein [bacterium]
MSSSRRDFLKASAVALAAGRGAQAEPIAATQ